MAIAPLPRLARRAGPRVDSTVSELEERRDAAKAQRRVFEHQWLLNIAMYLGHQWVRVDSAGMVYTPKEAEDRVTLVENYIRPAVRTSIAKQTKTQPVWVGVPASGSDDEVARARLRQLVFEHYWRNLEMRRKTRMWLWWRETCGKGFLKGVWDASKGETIRVAARGGQVVTDANGAPIPEQRVQQAIPEGMREGIEMQTVSFGDFTTRVVPPFELAVDPLATSEGLSSAEYVVEEAIYSPEQLGRTYKNVDVERLTINAKASPGTLEARFPGLTHYLDMDRGARGRRGVKVYQYWSIPGRDGGNGKHVVWTDDGDTLYDGDSGYPFLPYSEIAGLPSGRFWTDPAMNDLNSPQTENNKVISQIAENSERFGNPVRLRNLDSMQGEAEWQGVPGEEVGYHDTGQGPGVMYLPPPEMPGYVQNRVPLIQQAMLRIYGQNEVSQGSVPEGVTAASAISQLMEATDTMLGPDIAELSDGLRDAGRKLLWCVRAYATQERLIRIAGDDGQWDVFAFQGKNLGDPDADEVDIGSGLPQSQAQKQAAIQMFVNMFIQNGQAPPPRELRRIMRDFEVGGLDHFFGSIARDQAQCNDEHRRLLMGEPVPINSWDNDELHVSEHNDFRKSSRFGTLRLQPNGMQIMELFELHVQQHQQRLQTAANNAAAAQMAQAAAAAGQAPPGPDAVADGGAPDGALPSAQSEPSAGG